MKRLLLTGLLLLLVVLTACSTAEQNDVYTNPIDFYYLTESPSYQSKLGALCVETRELGTGSHTLEELVEWYLQGPIGQSAALPVPQNLELQEVSLKNGVLYLFVSDHWLGMTMLEEHLAEACLALTMTQLADVDQICIRTDLDETSRTSEQLLSPDDYLIYDDSATSDQVTVKLYFSDQNGRYLAEESRTRKTAGTLVLGEYILKQLLKGPESRNLLQTLPEGTNLLGIELSQGVCTVNFSEAFLLSRPAAHMQARMTVFSVVNSLTELSGIECVRFLCVGREIGDYSGIDLSRPLYREELAIQDDSASVAILDVTMYLPCGGEKLAAVPMTVRQSSGKMGAEAVLSALLSFKPANGYENPFPDGTALMNQVTRNGHCTVTFNSAFALRNADPSQMEQAVRCVVSTLCSLEQIKTVQIEVNNAGAEGELLGQTLTPEQSWFLP